MSALLAAGVLVVGVALLAVSPVAGAFLPSATAWGSASGIAAACLRRRAGAAVRFSCFTCVPLAVRRRRVAGRWSWFGSSGLAFALQGMQVCTLCARHTKPRCDQAVATG